MKVKSKKLPVVLRYVIPGLPLAGAVISGLLPLRDFARQFMILVVLVWIQAYFILEIFLAGK